MQYQRSKQLKKEKRHRRIRSKVKGTEIRPRLSVFLSHKNFYAQIIDDVSHKTLLSISTLAKEIRERTPCGGNITAARLLGEALSKKAKEKSITKVVLDKGPYLYHGRIKAFAEAGRLGGLDF